MDKPTKETPLIVETDGLQKPRWLPLAIIGVIIIAVILLFAFMSGGEYKDKDSYMKLLQDHQDAVID